MAHVKVTQLQFRGNIFTFKCFGSAAAVSGAKEIGRWPSACTIRTSFLQFIQGGNAIVEQNA